MRLLCVEKLFSQPECGQANRSVLVLDDEEEDGDGEEGDGDADREDEKDAVEDDDDGLGIFPHSGSPDPTALFN